jgi:hypothetical protein
MIGSVSAGSMVTGIRSPVRSILKLLHQFGAYAFFEHARIGVYVKVNIKGDDVDDSSSMDAAFCRLLLPSQAHRRTWIIGAPYC